MRETALSRVLALPRPGRVWGLAYLCLLLEGALRSVCV